MLRRPRKRASKHGARVIQARHFAEISDRTGAACFEAELSLGASA
jgi:hypothetical protein